MHYPHEAGFEETSLEPSDFIDVTDIDAIRDWFREHQEGVATSRTDFWDWTDGNVVPAMNTGEWVERGDANQKMYGLFATDEQDPNDYYFLYGGPVPVNTAGRSREEILDAVITEVLDQYTIGFDIPEDKVFVVELSDFPK